MSFELLLCQPVNARESNRIRLKRQGQKHQVIIHHLIARGTIDEQVMKAIRSKAEGQAAMMEAVRMLKENMHG